MPDSEQTPQREQVVQVNVVNQQTGSAVGVCGLVFGILGIFIFAIVFVPLSLILSIIAIFKRQYVLGICGIIAAAIAAISSPTIWIALGIGGMLGR